jgi:multidrug efflux pump subunit AcrA (membrane-fusion protein)
MKKKNKILITAGVVAVAAIGVLVWHPWKANTAATVSVQTTQLSKTSISNIVSTSGVIQSTDSVNVYIDLTYTIKQVNVKVGDHVNAGDVLCVLDSKDLKDSITQKQASINTNAAQAAQKIKTSEKTYDNTKSTLSAGLNTQVNDAADKVASARQDLETAQQKLSDAQKHVDTNTDSALISAKSAVDSAQLNLDNATKTYNDYKKQYKDELDTYEVKEQLHTYSNAIQSAQLTLDTAKKTLTALQTTTDEDVVTYTKAVATAQTNYDSAVKSQKAILASVNQSLDTSADSITTDKLSADQTTAQKELEALQTKLAKCSVTAPSSGTITAVNAVQNAPANGLLFVIEDTSGLKMTVKIKEYDIASVKTGMKAVIKADAISGKEFEGVLQKIAPTSLKGTDGKTTSSTDAEFEADVLVTSKDSGLLIGMNGTADIILEKKDSVYTVPFDAVTTDAQGKNIVYSVTAQKDGTYKTSSLPVTVGIETDSEIEISGSGLNDGLKIVSEGKQITEGLTVKLAGATGATNASESSGTSK